MLFQCRHWLHARLRCLPRLLPSSCALCGAASGQAFCPACRQQYFGVMEQRCQRCAAALPAPAAVTCGSCLAQPPAFDATIVASAYRPPVDQLVMALKFGHRLALAPVFAQLLRDAILPVRTPPGTLPDVLIAVPLGPRRLQQRGFNQALEIARPLAAMLKLPLAPRLALRIRDTQAQSQLRLQDRHANLRRAFSVSRDQLTLLQGRHIGVVDDVMTTGVTLDELARTLKRFGAARVTNYVFARTLHK